MKMTSFECFQLNKVVVKFVLRAFSFDVLMVVFLFSSFFLLNLNLISDSVEKERIYDYQFHTVTSNIKDFCLKIQLHDFP